MMRLYPFVLFLIVCCYPIRLSAKDTVLLLTEDHFTEQQLIRLSEMDGWVFKPGNDTRGADPDLNTNDWIPLKPGDLNYDYGTGKMLEGWFRLRFRLDSTIADFPLALLVHTWGAADIYLNGVKQHSLGNPDVQKSEHQPVRRIDRYIGPLHPPPGKDNLLSIYVVDHQEHWLTRYKSQQRPQNLSIGLAGPEFVGLLNRNRTQSIQYHMVWNTALLLLTLLFWTLYLLNRREKGLISIALISTSMFFFTFTNYLILYSSGIYTEILLFLWGMSAAITVGLVPIVLTKILFQSVPVLLRRLFWAFLILGIVFYFMPFIFAIIPVGLSLILSAVYIAKARKSIRPVQWIVIAGLLLTVFWMFVFLLVLNSLTLVLSNLLISGITLSLPGSLLIYVALRFREILLETRKSAREIVQLSEAKLAAEMETHKILENQKQLLEEEVEIRTAELKQSLEDLKNTQTQLVHAEKMASLGELTAGIAHEIQNPLNFVNNFAEVSIELIAEAIHEFPLQQSISQILDDINQNLEKIHHHGKRADAIVKGMLQHSRTNSGQKEPTDINALAEEYLRLSYHGLRAKDKTFNANFETDFNPNLPKIEIVPQEIGRVLLNLINNAFYAVSERHKKETPTGSKTPTGLEYRPTVTISTKNPGDRIEISVKDNGSGIPEEIKNKIFQPFFTTKPTGQGTGLGLSLSYDIVKAHGGEIRVSSIENQGTEFTITLKTN